MEQTELLIIPDTFERYMAEINRFPLLNREEETELARHWRATGEIAAAHRLICSNLRFVVKIAQEYRGYGLRLLDLVQEGNIGLMMAVKKFDPERGTRLISYAVWWIRAYMQNFIIRSWSLVKIGTTQAQKKLFFKLNQAREALMRLTGSDDADDLARELEVRGEAIDEMSQRLARRDLSLDLELFEDAGETYLDTLVDERDNQEEVLIRTQGEEQRAALVMAALSRLNERERHIVQARILNDQPQTLQELADYYRITRERVRQLEKNALDKLRTAMAPALIEGVI